MNEDRDIRKGVIKLMDVAEIYHGFSSFIHKGMKGCRGVICDEWDDAQVRDLEL